jgi:hypothetical protein
MQKAKQPLYRKVNTTARGVHHNFGGNFRDLRPMVKAGDEPGRNAVAMHAGARRGLDDTPLFRFLPSRVGRKWDDVFSEVVARVDRKEPIFWLVALREEAAQAYVRTGEASYFSGLVVDVNGVLRVADPGVGPATLAPQCPCCTHTFNGLPFTRRYDPEHDPRGSAAAAAAA